MASPASSAFPRGRALAAYVAAWLILWCVYAAAFVASHVPLAGTIRGATAAALPGALIGLVSLDLARRWPATVGGKRFAARLFPAVFFLGAAAAAGWYGLVCLDSLVTTGAVKFPALAIVCWELVINLLIQVAMTGIGYARHTAVALREARDLAARAEVLRTRAELQLLRSQLQPHFVHNVLHALLGLVRRDPAKAERALEKLGELLRFGQWVHQTGADWVPLSREWDFVRSYLDLERVRLGDRLEVRLDADPAAFEVAVPPFALQPLVENAIVHGVASRAVGGCVSVSARRVNGIVRVDVRDDGPGTSEKAIAASPRMGLRLLRERLAALYGGRARLTFESPAEGGWSVRLELPEDAASENA